jgi:hypothetical protein
MIDVGRVTDEFVGLLRAKPLGSAELVVAEPPETKNFPQAILVGPSDPDSPGMILTTGRDPSLSNRDVDQLEVGLIVRSWAAGDGGMPAQLSVCSALIDQVRAVVDENISRVGIWDRLEVGPQAFWHPVYTDRGANCWVALSLAFTVL